MGKFGRHNSRVKGQLSPCPWDHQPKSLRQVLINPYWWIRPGKRDWVQQVLVPPILPHPVLNLPTLFALSYSQQAQWIKWTKCSWCKSELICAGGSGWGSWFRQGTFWDCQSCPLFWTKSAHPISSLFYALPSAPSLHWTYLLQQASWWAMAPTGRLWLSDWCTLIMRYHKTLDGHKNLMVFLP